MGTEYSEKERGDEKKCALEDALTEKADKGTDDSGENKNKTEAEKPRCKDADDEKPNASLQ